MESSLGIEEFSLLADLLTNVDDEEGNVPSANMLGLQSKWQQLLNRIYFMSQLQLLSNYCAPALNLSSNAFETLLFTQIPSLSRRWT